MATTAYTIYSHYDPATQREQLERETGQRPPAGPEIDSADAWEVEAQLAFPKRQLPPPRFVPAVGERAPAPSRPPRSTPTSDVAIWYRSLTEPKASTSRPMSPVSAAPAPARPVPRERRSKNNWFIMNAISSSSDSAPTAATAAPSTLADILARDPPPLPHQERYKPPVFLALGPANKGFAMLQNSGWSEGEPLGPDVARRPPTREDMIAAPAVKREIKVEVLDVDEPIRKSAPAEIIDLTMADSESDEPEAVEQDTPVSIGEGSRKALITPIATVLKSDRLGIGLKAKTTGPYRESLKRITHNEAALAAHVNAAEALKKQKKLVGRGHRGFARLRKAEETHRRDLLAYMNT